MPTTRKTIKRRKPIRRITKRAVDIFKPVSYPTTSVRGDDGGSTEAGFGLGRTKPENERSLLLGE